MSKGVNLIFLDVDGVLNTSADHRKMVDKNYFVRDPFLTHLSCIIISTESKVVLSSTWRFSPEMLQYIKVEVAKSLKAYRYSNFDRFSSENFDNGMYEEMDPLSMYGDVVISVTPDLLKTSAEEEINNERLGIRTIKPLPENCHETRTDEILLWLRENVEFNNTVNEQLLNEALSSEHSVIAATKGDIEARYWLLAEKIKVKNFVCLDDMNLHYYSCYRLKSKIKEHLVLTKTSVGLTTKSVEEAKEILDDEEFDINEWAEECFVPCMYTSCYHRRQKADRKSLYVMQEQITKAMTQSEMNLKIRREESVSDIDNEDNAIRANTVPANMLNRVDGERGYNKTTRNAPLKGSSSTMSSVDIKGYSNTISRKKAAEVSSGYDCLL